MHTLTHCSRKSGGTVTSKDCIAPRKCRKQKLEQSSIGTQGWIEQYTGEKWCEEALTKWR
jgi:hypothetical protein